MEAVQKKEMLVNGTLVHTFCNPYVHSVYIGFYFHLGPVYEDMRNNGVSYVLDHLFCRRLNDLSQQEMHSQLGHLGATFHHGVYDWRAEYGICAPPSSVGPAFDILFRLLDHFTWMEEELHDVKEAILQNIAYTGSPCAAQRAEQLYFAGTPNALSVTGSAETIESLRLETIHLWKERFFQCANLCCVLTGSFTQQDASYIRDRLASCVAADPLPETPCVRPKGFGNRTSGCDNILPSDGGPVDIILSFDVDPAQNSVYQTVFLNNILALGDGSRLGMLLREEAALTDEVYGDVAAHPDMIKFTIYLTVANPSLPDALELLGDALAQSKTQLSEEDLHSNRVFLSENQMQILDDPIALGDLIGWGGYVQPPEVNPQQIAQTYASITLSDLQAAAKRILCGCNLTATVENSPAIFPAKEIRQKLDRLRQMLSA